MFRSDAPLISVITATRNAADALPITIASLKAQKFSGFEWLVADGGSMDGTVELLRDNADLISWQASGPDKGIYDAWNKACRHARGEWLLFLGAGDEFPKPETLECCAQYLMAAARGTVLAYGRLELLSEKNRVPLEVLGVPWANLQDRWEIGRPALPPHGACFHRRELLAGPAPFDLRFPIAADADLLLRHLVNGAAAHPDFIPMEVTRSPIGGVSFRLETARRVQREILAINRKLGICPPFQHRLREGIRMGAIRVLLMLPDRWARQVADGLRKLAGKPPRWSIE